MGRQLTNEDIRCAKTIYLYDEDTIYVVFSDTEDVYGSCHGGEWFIKDNFFDYFDSSLMLSYFSILTPEQAIVLLDKWKEESGPEKEAQRLNEAIEFAVKKHSGQFRKGTTIPYILHPLEVLEILYSMRADTDVMIAGVLHDTVEDTDTTLDEIRRMFGDLVAELVSSNSEDKSKSWHERKQHTINELATADKNVKMLIMADKLSNMRSIAFDYNQIGDKLWERFNAPREKQAWYYDGILDSLYDMQFIPECEKAYWEITGLFKDVFVKYYLDSENEIIYQACETGVVRSLKKGDLLWNDAFDKIADDIIDNIDNNHHYFKTNPIPDNAELISRKDAELTEDVWNKPFWDCHDIDIQDGEYCLLSSKDRCVDIKITNAQLMLICEDYGDECKRINGKDEYEFSYSLDEEDTHKFLVQLRMMHGLDISLEQILKKEFGKDEGPDIFENFCEEIGVVAQFYSC